MPLPNNASNIIHFFVFFVKFYNLGKSKTANSVKLLFVGFQLLRTPVPGIALDDGFRESVPGQGRRQIVPGPA